MAIASLCTGMVPAVAIAQEAGETEKEREKVLDEVMVTASRVSTPLYRTSKQVTVIGRQEIAKAPVQSLQDLLVYIAGVDVAQRGGHGVQADISLRGGTADQTAVLLNGINVSSAHTGHYSFDLPINLSDIERVEIVHGPAALIYGASAFAGGINIITKKSVDHTVYANVEAGMHKQRGIEVRGAAATGWAEHSLSVGYNASEGDVANSDYDLYNALWQTRMNLPRKGGRIDLQLGYNDKRYGANTFYSAKYPNQYERTSTYMATAKGEWGTTLKLIPILYWSRHHDQFDLIKDTDTGRNYHRNDTYGANLALNYTWRWGITTLAGEARREEILSSVLGKPMDKPHGHYKASDGRTNASVTLEHTINLEKWVLTAGALLNHNTLQPHVYKLYPSAGITYRPTEAWKVSASWSRSTRMPTFTDLYYTTATHNGNNGLKPERSESVDLGVTFANAALSAHVGGFLLWGRDMIDWVKESPEDEKWASWNLTKINTQGVEMGVKLHLANLLPALGPQAGLAVDYVRLHQTSDSGNLLSLYSLNYLRDKLTARFTHRIVGGLSAGWYFRYQKRMGEYEKYENQAKVGNAPYPAFSTLDLKLAYTYRGATFSIALNNLYNTRYFDLGNVPQPGFWLTGGVKIVIE
jgi:iron complex outermembrane receptor protein